MAENVTVEVVQSSARCRAGARSSISRTASTAAAAQWVPQFRRDMRVMLDRRHPFFERGRGAVLPGAQGRQAGGHDRRDRQSPPTTSSTGPDVGHFHFFDCIDDRDVSHALFEAAFEWLRGRGMEKVVGPYGFGFMGMGALVDGFEHRAVMTMMAYNYPWYGPGIEAEGFTKHRDQLSMFIDVQRLPPPRQDQAGGGDRDEDGAASRCPSSAPSGDLVQTRAGHRARLQRVLLGPTGTSSTRSVRGRSARSPRTS